MGTCIIPVDAHATTASAPAPHARATLPSIIAVLIWLAIVTLGLGTLWRYENTAGTLLPAPSVWPEASQLSRTTDQPKLVVFAHPKCPCTRATIDELERLMRFCVGKVDCTVVFIKPNKFAAVHDWEKADLWKSVQRMSSVAVACDNGGREASLFGAATSGVTMLYSANGRLLFRGGITASRGHAGDSLGKKSIIDFVTLGDSPLSETRVFGCELRSSSSTTKSNG